MKLLGNKESAETIVNTSISQTLTRSINTTLTTFVMVLILYILGVSSIREFALPLMVGLICGTYSSVCLSGSVWYVLNKKRMEKNAKPLARRQRQRSKKYRKKDGIQDFIQRWAAAKRAEMKTVHGNHQTPVFMNVGTVAAIKGAVSTDDLRTIGTQVELSNTYHLHVRTGDKLIRQFGGLHKFMNWDRPILTDSGGFQVFPWRDAED